MGASIAFLHPKDVGGVLTELVQAASAAGEIARIVRYVTSHAETSGRGSATRQWPEYAGLSTGQRSLPHGTWLAALGWP